MSRITTIFAILLPLLIYGQGNLSEKVDNKLNPIKLSKNVWIDTTLGWSTLNQYHLKRKIAKFYECAGAFHLYEYIVKQNKNGTFQLDRRILLDSTGKCYDSSGAIVCSMSELTEQLNYSVVYDSSFNILKIKYRKPIILNSQKLLVEAHENYIWEEMQFGKWLIQCRDSMLYEGELPVHNFKPSPMAQAHNDSVLHKTEFTEVSLRLQKDSLSRIFISQHKLEIDSCETLYRKGNMSEIQDCLDCYNTLFTKYRYNKEDGLPRTVEMNKELQDLTTEFTGLISQADKAYNEKNWKEALKYYEKALGLGKESQYALKQIEKIKQLSGNKLE